MRTKEALLNLLEAGKNQWLSGEDLAERLNISRTAVWKAINTLREEGIPVQAVRSRGYRLDPGRDLLTEGGIRQALPNTVPFYPEILTEVPSTNALLRERALQGAPEGTVIAAGEQTGGRGRMGRSFYSPPDTGIYISLLLRPENMPPEQACRTTTMAAAAVCRAIETAAGIQTQIKWVNDVLLNGRKVCGILTEASVQVESGLVDYLILGIGMNVYPPREGFPPELRGIAGVITEEPRQGLRDRLTAEFLKQFFAFYRSGEDHLDEYRRRSIAIGKTIRILTPTGERNGQALDIDNACRLIVRTEDGRIEALSSAEISIRAL